MEKAIDVADPDTRIIPGNGLDVVGRDELVEFRDMIRVGMKLDEVVAARVA